MAENMQKKKVAAVGFSCIDVYENMDNRCYATGNGVDVVINLSKRGIKSSVVTAVGDDKYGELMLNTLGGYGLDTSHVHVKQGDHTAVIKMLMNGTDRIHGERLRGVMEHYDLEDGDLEFIHQHDIVHTDLSWNVIDRLPEIRTGKTKIFLDFSIKKNYPQIEKVLSHINWGMFSFETYTEDVKHFLKWGISWGPEVLIATFGKDGAVAYDGTQFHYQGLCEDSGVVNTVGAGDAFATGFLFGLISRLGIKECLYQGALNAAEIVSKFEPY
jgi:fructoselysine 6-kinase